MYLVTWWQLWPQTDERPWMGDDGEPERFLVLKDAVRRKEQLLQDVRYRHLAFRVREEDRA